MKALPAALVLALALPVGAQEAGVDRVSGPEAGRPLPAIRVYVPVGAQAGKEIDLGRILGKDTGCLLFIHELTRNTAPVIRGLDQMARERRLLGFRYFPVLLHPDRTQAETRLKAVNGSLRMTSPIVLSLDGGEGPGELALNRKCTLTLILTKDGKVARSVGFTDTGMNDVPRVKRWIAEVAGTLPETAAEWRERLADRLPKDSGGLQERLVEALLANQKLRTELRRVQGQLRQAQRANRNPRRRNNAGRRRDPNAMRRGAERGANRGAARGAERGATSRPANAGDAARGKLKGKAPEDEVLRGLIRPFINKLATTEKIDDLYLEITTHADTSKDLQKQVYDMFRLVLSAKYGTEYARKVAEKHVREFEKKR